MTRSQAEKWERLALDALRRSAQDYAIASGSSGEVSGVLVAGARLRLAAKAYHEATVQRLLVTAAAEAASEVTGE